MKVSRGRGPGRGAAHRPGDLLTPDDKGRLAKNFKGYDISPDMIRLSLVNLYLHGFTDPHIFEYDTLTSEERWNEFADVILANPPFMSPKGGIKPHKRFSIQAKRSEVLFVDYMAEHLTPTGRAAIIVPEGTDEREYADAVDQIREVLIHGNYLSQKDIEICLGFDVESIADRPGIDAMRELHAALVEKYKVEDATTPE